MNNMRDITMKPFKFLSLMLRARRSVAMGRITILITLLLFMAGCNLLQSKDPTEETLAYESNFEIIGKEKDSLIGHLHPDLFEPAIKGKKISEANVLFIDS